MSQLLSSRLAILLLALPSHALGQSALTLSDRPIARSEPVEFTLDLDQGKTYLIWVRQKHVDLAIELQDPIGETFGPHNSPLANYGWEQVLFTPSVSGGHKLTLSVADESNVSGFFDVAVSEPNLERHEAEALEHVTAAMSIAFLAKDNLAESLALYERALRSLGGDSISRSVAHIEHAIARLHEMLEEPSNAITHYSRARAAYAKLEETELVLWMQYRRATMETSRGNYDESRRILKRVLSEAETHSSNRMAAAAANYIGVNHYYEGDFDKAESRILESLETLQRSNLRHDQATTLYNLGWIRTQEGETEKGLTYFRQALDIELELGDVDEQVDTHVSIATALRMSGQCGAAIAELDIARTKALRRENSRKLARVMSRAGACYSILGDYRSSNSLLEHASLLAGEVEDKREQATAINLIGGNRFAVGNYDEALSAHETALKLRREINDRDGVSQTLISLALDLIELGDTNNATKRLTEAEQIVDKTNSTTKRAKIALVNGILHRQAGQLSDAERNLVDALDKYAQLKDTGGQLDSLMELGRLFARNDRTMANRYLDRAIDIAEHAADQAYRPELRARHYATQSAAFFLRASIDVDSFASKGDKAYAVDSLRTINRGLARALRSERHRLRLDGSLVGENAARRQAIQKRIAAKLEALQQALNSAGPNDKVSSRLRADVELLQVELDAVASEAYLAQPERNSIRPIDQEPDSLQDRLPSGTAVLQFAVDGKQGLAWFVTRDEILAQRLENFDEIEADIAELNNAIRRRGAYRVIGKRLSERLLTALRDSPSISRLLIVADGPLNHLPFALLPHPLHGSPLIESLEIQRLPSSAMPMQGSTDSKIQRIAVLADAVFGQGDARVGDSKDTASPTIEPGIDSLLVTTRAGNFARLPFSAMEARNIRQLGGTASVTVATGFDATKDTLRQQLGLSPDVLHIATHGITNLERPELTGLALSSVDEDGQKVDNFLSVSDVYSLDEVPRLVVLSACETAIGEYVRGEGQLSLANAFIQRGANDVVATLWQVADRSTAELMTVFYENLLGEEQRSASALRAAQMQIKSQRRWSHPYYWAGFTTTSVDPY
ncbi:MAG: CHAT domain-containing tetratricopeptide repeat protein [Pseudomonadota bacterium]